MYVNGNMRKYYKQNEDTRGQALTARGGNVIAENIKVQP